MAFVLEPSRTRLPSSTGEFGNFLTLRLSDYLLKRGTAFKMIDTLANAEQLQCGGMGVLQIGKPITVYPLLEEDMGGLIGELRHLTKNACGLRAITDVAISDSSCLSLRNETWPRKTPTAEQLSQARSRFPDLLAPERVKVSLPERYVVVGRISVRGAGLRLKALDLDSSTADRVPRFVFIKEGRRCAERDVQGIDAYERLFPGRPLLCGRRRPYRCRRDVITFSYSASQPCWKVVRLT